MPESLKVRGWSPSQVKDALTALLNGNDHRVFALTGRWGTGKTYLWRQIEREHFSGGETENKPVTTSLFGVRTLNEFKLRLLTSLWSKDQSAVKKALSSAGSLLRGVVQKFSGVTPEEAALVWLPDMLKGRLVVVDDVERKNKALEIDEFLGFLDEYSDAYGVRFLLLLNKDKLGESAEIWSRLHEKVIDAEIVLSPTPQEALQISLQKRGREASYDSAISEAIKTLEITNIRVINRVLSIADRIFVAGGSNRTVPPQRWIPSTVLLTASHFRAVENPPSFEYISALSSWSHLLRDGKKNTPEEAGWNEILHSLGISSADLFEELLYRFLQTGVIDATELQALFASYAEQNIDGEVEARRMSFVRSYYWAPEKTPDVLIAEAELLLPDVAAMSIGGLSEVVRAIEAMKGWHLARRFLDDWKKNFLATTAQRDIPRRLPSDEDGIHPEIISTLQRCYDQQNPPLSLLEAITHFVQETSWSPAIHETPLDRSTQEEYFRLLKGLTGTLLADTLYLHLRWMRTISQSQAFQNASNNFVTACKQIRREEPESRLSEMVMRAFRTRALENQLDLPEE